MSGGTVRLPGVPISPSTSSIQSFKPEDATTEVFMATKGEVRRLSSDNGDRPNSAVLDAGGNQVDFQP